MDLLLGPEIEARKEELTDQHLDLLLGAIDHLLHLEERVILHGSRLWISIITLTIFDP